MSAVVVVGSINIDLVVRTSRLPRPGETVHAGGIERHPGGKGANQAVAAARAGASTRLVGALGDDDGAPMLEAFLEGAGVDVSGVRRVVGPTGTAIVCVDDAGENAILVVRGANGELLPSDVRAAAVSSGDVVLTQLEIPFDCVEAALVTARAAGATAVLNAAPAMPEARALASLADVVVVNERERQALGDRPDVPVVIVTLGPRGALAHTRDGTIEVPGRTAIAVDTTGAGDCFAGVLAARLAARDGLHSALRWANAAAWISVTRRGAGSSMPTGAEIESALA